MSLKQNGFDNKLRAFVERILAVETAPSRRKFAADPFNIFEDDLSERRLRQIAIFLALLLHLILFLIYLPTRSQVFIPTEQVVVLRSLAKPGLVGGGGGSSPQATPPKPVSQPETPKTPATLIPIPDPTPDAPEVIRKREIELPKVIEEITENFNLGEINAPVGSPGKGGSGSGSGAGSGVGSGSGGGAGSGEGGGVGDGSGPYVMGSGITNPELLVQTTPNYTDEAIRAKIQGTVYLQCIIRKDGRVDSFKVLRGLGYGLEEKAIQEIATKWRFRPGMLNGRPVDVLAHIEVSFNLR
ncbi:MAG: TonB family protein [Acidobacteria bacterium]|nr:TonB family protein [Acidobacteriota bacterium]